MYSRSLAVSLLLLGILSLYTAPSTAWEFCGGTAVKVNTVKVEECPASEDTCQLKRATNQTIYITFTPLNDFKMLNLTVKAKVAVFDRDFPLSDGNVCHIGAHCPLESHNEQTIRVDVYLPEDYPMVRTSTEWNFLSADGNLQGCFKITFQIIR